MAPYKELEIYPMILFGILTDEPSSDKSLVLEAGFLYLEDSKTAIFCNV